MDTLTERETEREDVPRRQDGSIDLNELARGLLEDCLNAVMSEQADELLGEGNRRNGYRERSLNTCVGRITLRIPKLREGTYFPDDVLRPYSRTDRAMVGAIAETYRLGLSHRKIERAASKLGFGELSSWMPTWTSCGAPASTWASPTYGSTRPTSSAGRTAGSRAGPW